MFKTRYLCVAMAATTLSGLTFPAFAADDAEVAALRQEVNELKQLVQQLSAKQTAASVPAVTMAAAPIPTEAAPARTKDGWAILPDGKSSAKLYGFIRGDVIHDFKGAPPEKFSDLDKQPLNSSNPVKNKTQFTVNTTRIGVDFKTPTALGDVGGKIEGDFWGSAGNGKDAAFRFRHAYLTWNNLLIGQTWSPFAAQDLLPETVDFNTLSGGSLRRRPQIRYTYPIDTQNTVMVAAEEAMSDARLPVLTAKFEHKLANDKGMVNIRAMAHEKRAIVDSTNNRNTVDEEAGFGVAVGGLINITPATKISGQYFHVKGDGSYVYGAGSGYSVDTAKHEIYLDELDSAIIGLTHKFNPQWRGTVAASWIGFKDDTDFAKANLSANKDLKQASINLMYNPVPSLTFGGEYTYGERQVFSDDEGKQSRVNLMARYSF
jgi:hypothetical protein